MDGVEGEDLHVDERGSGIPVLLLHGFTGSVAAWGDDLLDALAAEARTLAVDLPGHGRSPDPPSAASFAIERVLDRLERVLDRSGVDRAVWIGYSMGGRLAVAAAVLRPLRVRALVVESGSPGLAEAAEREARREADEELARTIEREGIERFVDRWMAHPLFRTQRRLPPGVRARERERRLSNRPASLARCLGGMGTGVQPSFWERLDEVAVPVLLLTGGEDRKFGEIADRMAERLPEATRTSVPDAGHAVHLERPEAWLDAVTPFLRKLRA